MSQMLVGKMMTSLNKDIIKISTEQDMVLIRHRVRDYAQKIGMSVLDQTKLITACSELARNILVYAGNGKATIEVISERLQTGIKVVFEDKGPGIADIQKAMQDGFSTGKSLGLGLPGAKRLVNYFDIQSKVGHGTTVTIIRWKR
ncbi:anti-sigma regulatory factor [Catalinimonas niigatensis]|uniref:anti-sigma regulatory factor n=1 Tax=Catalinimonas niigatensis TaxID=1397264 RepID=UPI002666B5F0|nr:anti-sigma regulatory factor [Catalinimonas niigatensis]WPP49774.1 anti-sigma regulatory factor [Catalinimonas niigatensis]